MITVSRLTGSRGNEIAKEAARRLGIPYYAQELVHEIAVAAHVHESSVEPLEKQRIGDFEAMLQGMLEDEAFSADDYLRHLRRVLGELTRRGSGVVMGRGSHLVYEASMALRVRLIGPIEKRIVHVAERDGIPMGEAQKRVHETDRQREDYHRRYFESDWADPQLFDIVLNTGSLTNEQCVDIIVSTFSSRFGRSAAPEPG